MTLDGGGTVELADSASNFLRGASGTNSLINEDNLIQGAGFLGNNNLQVINRGTVEANGTNKLTLDPPTAGFVNKGIMRAVGSSTLRIQNGTVTNTESSVDGTIRANAGTLELSGATISGGIIDIVGAGTITLSSSSTISGGTVTNTATGLIQATSSSNRLSGAVTNPSGGNIQIDNGATLIFDGSGTYSSAGTILIDGTTTTQLQIDGDATISGGGTIELTDSVNNFLQGFSAPDSLINEDLTIKGAGNIGANTLQLINRGVVEANGTNKLTLDPPTAGFVNKGTMRAVGGSTLRIQNGTVTNAESSVDGTIRANASTLELSGATISGGIVDIVGAGTITLSSSSTISGGTVTNTATGLIQATSSSNRLSGAVTNPIGGNIQIDNGATLIFDGSGTYSSAGTILIDGTTTTQLQIDGDASISGGGTIELSDSVNNFLQGLSVPDSLINEDLTIKGAGNIGANTLQLINRGVVEANGTNKLTLDPPTAGFVNKGTMRAVGGSTLRIQNGTVTNTESSVDGTIRANASTLELSGATISGGIVDIVGAGTITLSSSTISGGTVTNTATGLIQATSSSNRLSGAVTNPFGGNIQIDNGATLIFDGSGTYSSAGTILIDGTTTTQLQIDGDATISGGGTIELSDSVNNFLQGFSAPDSLINEDLTIKGAGNIGNNTLQLINRGTVEANGSNLLTLDPPTAGFVNKGTIRAVGGAILRIQNGTVTNTESTVDGTIEAIDNSTVQLSGAIVDGGIIRTSNGGLIEVISSSTLKNLPTSLEADVQVNNLVTLTLVGAIHNTGTINVNATTNSTGLSINDGDVTLTGGGMIFFSDSLNNFVTGNSSSNSLINEDNAIEGAGFLGSNIIQLINRGSISATGDNALTIDLSSSTTNEGTFAALGSGGLSFADAFTNQASVVVGSGSQFLVTGNFTQTGGFTLADGLVDPTGIFDLVDGGLGGSGTVAANVTSGGLIAPGNSAGTLAVVGDLTMTSTAALAFEIGGLSQGTKYDFLSVSGSASLDGDLEFSFFNGGQNLIGDTDALEVLGATTITGSFFNVASGDRLIAIDGKGSFIVNYGSGSPFNPGSVILSDFILIPEPRVYGMILAVAVSMVVATRRRSVRAGK